MFNLFEETRNSTSFYQICQKFGQQCYNTYKSNDIKKVLQFHQMRTTLWFSGFDHNNHKMVPRGILINHQMGSGKTITFIASSLYSLYTNNKIYTDQSRIITITNKSLQEQTKIEIRKYINKLNEQKLTIDWKPQPQDTEIQINDIMDKFVFVVYNDTQSLGKKVNEIFSIMNKYKSKIIVFDEAQNLFRSVLTESKRGQQLYDIIMNENNCQVLFSTGTPMSSQSQELSVCFNMLTQNNQLLPIHNFQSLFIQPSEFGNIQKIINKEIFIKRIIGLVSTVNTDIEDDPLFPTLLPTKVIQLQMSSEVKNNYQEIKRLEIHDKFMQRSRIASNMVLIKEQVYSDKFQAIKSFIEDHPNELHIVFSNYVETGCLSFQYYCQQTSNQSSFTWIQNNTSIEQQRKENQIIILQAHGNILPINRQLLITMFNQPNNLSGNIATVLMLSPASFEGINLKCVKYVHIMEPQWNFSNIRQIIYRAVRLHSHYILPENERFVQSILYITYDKQPSNLIIKENTNSTDQKMFYKMMKKGNIINQFEILLSLASFDCFYSMKVSLKRINKLLGINQTQEDTINLCFQCNPNNKQLFNKNNIMADITNTNCNRIIQALESNSILHKNINYIWIKDIYSTSGIKFKESRNIMGDWIDDNSNLFRDLIELYNSQFNVMKPIDDENDQIQQIEQDHIIMELAQLLR